jgi:hypothetical protein
LVASPLWITAVRGGVPAVRGGVPAVRGGIPAVRGGVPAVRRGVPYCSCQKSVCYFLINLQRNTKGSNCVSLGMI